MVMADGASARPIAIGNYDFRSSGTVAKSIQIATACAHAGLPSQLWVVRARGPMLDAVPPEVPVIETGGIETGAMAIRTGRRVDLALAIPAIARAIRRHQPALFLSGGNHFHLPARYALALSGRRAQTVLGLRASNSSRRAGRDPGTSARLKYSGSDFIAAVSEELAAEVEGLVRDTPIVTIPNGVDIDRVSRLAAVPFDHRFLSGSPRPPVLATMGRLTCQKGFDLLIEAFALLPSTLAARLLVIGEGPDLDSLMRLANELKVAERVEFLGQRANPFSILSRCDLYVSASRWEGSSNALLEALACGLPLVATDCPSGSREVITRGPFGTLAPTEDPAGLAAAIERELATGRSHDAQREGAYRWAIEPCLDSWVSLLRDWRSDDATSLRKRSHNSPTRSGP